MKDSRWEIDGISVDAYTGTSFGEQIGEPYQFPFIVADGIASRSQSADTRYSDIRDYVRYASEANYGTGVDGRPWFDVDLPGAAPTSTLLVSVEPGPDTAAVADSTRGVWALVVGGEDQTTNPGIRFDFELELFVLGYVGDDATDDDYYVDKSAVRNELNEPFKQETL
jgi:hypothetical protein